MISQYQLKYAMKFNEAIQVSVLHMNLYMKGGTIYCHTIFLIDINIIYFTVQYKRYLCLKNNDGFRCFPDRETFRCQFKQIVILYIYIYIFQHTACLAVKESNVETKIDSYWSHTFYANKRESKNNHGFKIKLLFLKIMKH